MKAFLTTIPLNITGIWGIHWRIHGKEGRVEYNPKPFSSWKMNHETLSNSMGSIEHLHSSSDPELGFLPSNTLPVSTLQAQPAS